MGSRPRSADRRGVGVQRMCDGGGQRGFGRTIPEPRRIIRRHVVELGGIVELGGFIGFVGEQLRLQLRGDDPGRYSFGRLDDAWRRCGRRRQRRRGRRRCWGRQSARLRSRTDLRRSSSQRVDGLRAASPGCGRCRSRPLREPVWGASGDRDRRPSCPTGELLVLHRVSRGRRRAHHLHREHLHGELRLPWGRTDDARGAERVCPRGVGEWLRVHSDRGLGDRDVHIGLCARAAERSSSGRLRTGGCGPARCRFRPGARMQLGPGLRSADHCARRFAGGNLHLSIGSARLSTGPLLGSAPRRERDRGRSRMLVRVRQSHVPERRVRHRLRGQQLHRDRGGHVRRRSALHDSHSEYPQQHGVRLPPVAWHVQRHLHHGRRGALGWRRDRQRRCHHVLLHSLTASGAAGAPVSTDKATPPAAGPLVAPHPTPNAPDRQLADDRAVL